MESYVGTFNVWCNENQNKHTSVFSTILVYLELKFRDLNSQDQTVAHIKADITS